MEVLGAQLAHFPVPIVIGGSILYIGLIWLALFLVRVPLIQRREKADIARLKAGLDQDKTAKLASEKTLRNVNRLLLWAYVLIAVAALSPFMVGLVAYLAFGQTSPGLLLRLASLARDIATIGGLLGIVLTLVGQGVLRGIGSRIGNILFDKIRTWLRRLRKT